MSEQQSENRTNDVATLYSVSEIVNGMLCSSRDKLMECERARLFGLASFWHGKLIAFERVRDELSTLIRQGEREVESDDN